MSLTIDGDEADRLAWELAQATGESLTEAVLNAIRERLARYRTTVNSEAGTLHDQILEIGRRCAALPTLDDRSTDEILGYDDDGLPR
jgi:antitoxin VapB